MSNEMNTLNAIFDQREAEGNAKHWADCEWQGRQVVAEEQAIALGYTDAEAQMFVYGFLRYSPKSVNPRQYGFEEAFRKGRTIAVTPEMKRAMRVAALEASKAAPAETAAPFNPGFGLIANGEI
ncbi:hypothetical protein [Vreelandella sp. EE22]